MTAYEWVIKMNGGQEYYLTEKQFEYFNEHADEAFVMFDDFGFRPSFMSSCYKQEAFHIKEKYFCKKCNGNGYFQINSTDKFICHDCEGTGVKV